MHVIRGKELKYIPAGHEDPKNPGVWKKVLVKRDDLEAGRLQMLNWAKLPPGKSFRPHYHEDMQELFIVLHGTIEMSADKEKVMVKKGDAIIVPAGEAHTMRNLGKTDAEYIVLGVSTEHGGKTVLV